MTAIESLIKEKVKELLTDKKIGQFIGYQKGSDPFSVSPCFITKPGQVDKLIWNPFSVNNLVLYLTADTHKPKQKQKSEDTEIAPTGILVKGCDSRALVQLISEHKIKREQVYILGVTCNGIWDKKKCLQYARKANIPANLIMEMDLKVSKTNQALISNNYKKTYTFPYDELVMNKCLDCQYPNPVLYDKLFGEAVEPKKKEDREIEAWEDKSPDEKWRLWSNYFSRCMRCSACKNICPLCYCNECAIDHDNIVITPATTSAEKADKMIWVERQAELPENTFFHLARMMHMAGRCVNCGECERACPMNIPLNLLTKKVAKDVRTLFSFTSGLDMMAPPLLATFKEDDPGDFIK